jgi:hypothetical protein
MSAMNLPEPFNDPTVLAYMLLMPLAIIGLAKMWKRLKDKKAAKAALATGAPTTEAGAENS